VEEEEDEGTHERAVSDELRRLFQINKSSKKK
jgi:hypothetical protein